MKPTRTGKHRIRRGASLGLALAALVGCATTEPYVFKAGEFDRNAPDFNREPADRTEVTVCYGRLFSSAEDVARVAEAACGRFGKRAVAREEGFGACPLLTPIEARFGCAATAQPSEPHG